MAKKSRVYVAPTPRGSDFKTEDGESQEDFKLSHLVQLVFLDLDQPKPASLIQKQLQMAGIETNPGPKWPCGTCTQNTQNKRSIRWFCRYISDMPTTREDVKITCYADDITVHCSHADFRIAVTRINRYLTTLKRYLEKKQLIVSVDKCGALLLSPWNKEWKLELDVRMGKEAIKTVTNLKLLGLHVDHGLTFNLHVNEIKKSAARKNNVLKCLTSPSNGLQKEELTRVYRACTRSVIYYAAPAWTPLISQTNWRFVKTTPFA